MKIVTKEEFQFEVPGAGVVLTVYDRVVAEWMQSCIDAQADAKRFLWLTDDHPYQTRLVVQSLCQRLPQMSASAVRAAIDAAMKEGQ